MKKLPTQPNLRIKLDYNLIFIKLWSNDHILAQIRIRWKSFMKNFKLEVIIYILEKMDLMTTSGLWDITRTNCQQPTLKTLSMTNKFLYAINFQHQGYNLLDIYQQFTDVIKQKEQYIDLKLNNNTNWYNRQK